MVQQTFTDRRAAFYAGQISRSWLGFLHRSGVNAQAGRPRIDDIVFAGVWASGDTQTTTIGGNEVEATLQAGDDTVAEAAARALAALNANATVGELASFALHTTSVENDTVRVTSLEVSPGSGVYHNSPVSSAEDTAGNGTAAASNIQTRLNRGDLRFGVGVALDTSDATGRRMTLPAATGFRFGGVVIHTHAIDNRALLGDLGVPANDAFSAGYQGYFAVRVDSDVIAALTPGAPAFCKYATDGNGPAGQFRHNNTNADAVAGHFTGRYVSGSNPLAEILINHP